MGLKFHCSHCGNEIYVKYLKIGELAKCYQCGQSTKVPGDAEQEFAGKVDSRTAETSEMVDPELENTFKRSLEHIDARLTKPLNGMAISATIMLWITSAVYFISTCANIYLLIILWGIKDFSPYSINSRLAFSNSIQPIITWISNAVSVVCAILFLIWFYRAHNNLENAYVDLDHESKWTAWGFLVPVMNFIRPHQMMTETWRGSAVMSGIFDYKTLMGNPGNAKVDRWFAAGIVAVSLYLLGIIILLDRFFGIRSGSDFIITFAIFSTVLTLAEIIFTVHIIFSIAIIKEITHLQTNARKISMIKSGSGQPA